MSLATVFNYFANSLWQVPLLAVCCWCGLRLAGASVKVRYAAWIVTLLLCVALPLRSAAPKDRGTVTVSTGDAVALGAALQPVPALPFYAVTIAPRTRDLLAEIYLGLLALLAVRLAISYIAQRRLVSRACLLSADQAALVTAMEADASRVRVLPAGAGTPMVAGVWRAKVLLPEGLLTGETQTLRAVLAHEFAHLERRDTVVNLLLRVLALPVAYHPATVLIQCQIQHARELLCDAKAASVLPSPYVYAQALLQLAQQAFVAGDEAPRSAVGLFERTSKPLLEERIMNLIAPPAPVRFGSRWLRVTAGATVFCAAAATASIVHLTPSVMAAEQVVAAPVPPVATDAGPAVAAAPAQPTKTHRKGAQAGGSALPQVDATLTDAQFQQQMQDLVKTNAVDNAEFRKEMEQLTAELKSSQFKEQMQAVDVVKTKAYADAMAQAMKQTAAAQKQLAAVRKQMNSPEFRRQMAQATAEAKMVSPDDLQKMIAEATANSLSAMASGQQGPVSVSGGVMASQILTKVTPVYPPDAKAAHISGTVLLHAIIAKDGAIASLQLISGPPELTKSAWDAVKQWVYKPYLLNGEPTEVDTTITVTYSFGG